MKAQWESFVSVESISPGATDAQLVAASLAGQCEAFGTIVRRYQGLITGVVYNRCRGNITRSEELAQDTFVAAWQNLSTLQDADRLGAWLCGIARNVANAAARNDQRLPAVSVAFAEAESSDRDPSEEAISREREQLLWETLAQIPDKYREPMILFYRHEKSAADVAQALELNEMTVRKRLQRGRAMLKKQVAALVEDTLSDSAPNTVFTAAVLAALPVMTAKTAAASTGGGVVVGTASATLATTFAFLIGPVIGMLGGLLGAWNTLRQTRSAREKKFVITMTIVVFLFVTIFVGFQLNIHRLRDFMSAGSFGLVMAGSWLAYAILLTLTVRFYNRRHRRIREEDGTDEDPDDWESPWDKPVAVRASLAGGIFGSTLR